MIISFDNKKLREVCEDHTVAIRECGIEVAQQLQNRLTDLIVAQNILQLPAVKPKYLTDITPFHFSLDLCLGKCLFLVANNVKLELSNTNLPIWENINRIKVLNIDTCK